MKQKHAFGLHDKPGEDAIIARDLDCMKRRGSLRDMSVVEADRHLLVMMLGLARGQIDALTSDRDMWKAMYGALKAATDGQDAR
jgi:hypothetical protein